jgi:hypothetical protein
MRKTVLIVSLLIASLAVGVQPAKANVICASNSICFADLVGGVSTEGLSGTIARNVWHNLTHPNTASEIDNETVVQWKVATGPNGTGTIGTIYASHDGTLASPFNNNIESAMRTSTP